MACLDGLLNTAPTRSLAAWTDIAAASLVRGDWSCAFSLSTLMHRSAFRKLEAARGAGAVGFEELLFPSGEYRQASVLSGTTRIEDKKVHPSRRTH